MPDRPEPVVGIHLGALRDLSRRDLLVRFAFGAAISAIAGIVSVLAGSQPGGLLLAFPAILPATLTLVEKDESERQAEDLDLGSILGAASLAAFAAVVWQYMPAWNPAANIVAALAAWLAMAVGLYLAIRLGLHERPLHRGLAELRAGPSKAAGP